MKAIFISIVLFLVASTAGVAQSAEQAIEKPVQIEQAEAPAPADAGPATTTQQKGCGDKAQAKGCCASKEGATAKAGCGDAQTKKACCAKGHAQATVKEEEEQK